MFRSLKIKLTLINVGVIVFISAFLMSGIYYMMSRGITGHAEELMTLIASDVGSGKKVGVTRSKKYSNDYFYAKINRSGEISETSQSLPISREQLQVLIAGTLEQKKERGLIKQNEEPGEYRFLKFPLKNNQGLILVFMARGYEKLLIGHLLAAFLFTGLGAAALTLVCSLFLAKRALVPIQQSWQRQKNFVADASHELRTPLTVIQTNMDIVVDNPNDTVENNMIWLQNIQAECKLMAKLVEDLLFLARADSEQPVIYMENFELSNALKEALDPFQPAAGQHNLRLNKKLGRHVNFYGDQMRIKQLVSILIDNAIKYTPSGGDINLQLNDNPDNIEIIVSDTGEGIEPEHLTKIFERFYRVDKARARESGGTGLGLSIAELIVKEHHGTIKVRSKAGSGTAFTVSFPKDRKISAFLM